MTRRAKLWRAGAVLFGIINLGGMGYALAMNEMMHALSHAFLLFVGLGAYLLWKAVTTWAGPQSDYEVSQAAQPDAVVRGSPPMLVDQRLDYLQQSVDALALEVERLGEQQRFKDKQP